MTYEQIHKLFKQRYNQNNWKQFLGEAFAKSRLLATPEILTGIDTNVASQVQKLGYITLNENGIERQIAVYDVTLAQGIILERNRVGLRNLLRKYWKDIDAAFIAYHRPETPKWRFTYVSELTGYDADGEFVKIKTEPKRYTYVLGEGESTRTAAERFTAIANKGSKATLDDVKEAFSVEKLSKAFFDEYKKHYDIFCDFMVSKPNIRQTIFNGDEKGIRDFNKKLLGRIVFLYFIQKKGWLGVPAKSDWGKGDFDFLTNLFKNTKNTDLFYSEMLSKLFFDTLNTKRKDDLIELVKGEPCRIPYLNGGLFEEDDKKHRNLIFPANLFKSLFDFFNQYNFTIYEDDPNDHTVAVDPEMLGHIFENLLEDNKDKGAYYTPKEIVHYMCQESLIEYLTTWFENKGYEVVGYIGFDKPDQPKLFSANEGRKGQLVMETDNKTADKQIDRILIEKLLKKKLDDDDKKLIKKHSVEFHNALDNVKICDPAIGSGAFPMGLLHEIFTAKQTLHTFVHGNTKNFPASAVKLNIIQNSIYGVDIEKGAVDIARLRFWLSLIVDEETPKALPNLDYKIVVGNSLVSKLGDDIIDIDWTLEGGQGFQVNIFGSADLQANKAKLLKKISQEQKEFFNPDSDKKKLAADIRKLKIDLLINQLELMVSTKGLESKPTGTGKQLTQRTELHVQTLRWKDSIKQLKKLKDKQDQVLNYFDWKLDFPEVLNEQINANAGFDIVIANPPYIKEYTNRDAFEGFRQSPYYQGKMDIWYGFACKMLDLLKPKGIECFIAQNNWITSAGAAIFRNKVLTESEIKVFTDFGNYKVFETAGIQTMIYVLQKTTPNNEYDLKYSVLQNDNISKAELIEFLIFAESDSNSEKFLFSLNPSAIKDKPFTFNNNTASDILDRIKVMGNIYLTEKEVANGIHPHYDFVSKKIAEESNGKFKKGEGIFGLSTFKKRSLGLSREELKLVKPYYTTEELGRYYANPKNKLWIIYTGSEFKNSKAILPFPNLKKHLDRFKNVITSDNRPYGLHRAREERFFIGESIVAQRKCPNRPSFTYTDFNCYVSATFYVIQTGRLNMKYLTALLNSKLIAYWLRNKGKMQGNNYQIDKEPLLAIPLIKPTDKFSKSIEKIVVKILDKKSEEKDTISLEQEIDILFYKLYELTYDEVKVIDAEFSLSKKEYEAIKSE
ncbi:N-6 DNA methylase [Daejeonella sp. H1SJ63]|uniref:Eco57I restriction-modification methylase domain-containing protein n=1 Tax=Daejeonella sp. H1SJ63 TaxID=3034145 RepID=UPI0023EC82DB|nr:N-6 DNA methylase [Daejeonella sp. H1SJ63]